MASVPNMRPGCTPAPAAPPGVVISDIAEFARTIALVPSEALQAVLPDEEGDAPETPEIETEAVETQPADPASIVVAIAPLLEAQVAAPAPAPAPKAEAVIAAAPVVAAPPAAAEVKQRKAPQPKVAAPEAKASPQPETPLPEGETKPAAPENAREKEAIAAAKRALDAEVQSIQRPARHAPHHAPATLPVADLRPQPEIVVTAPIVAPAPIETAPVRVRETAPAPERTLDLRRESEWLDRLARDIAQAAGNEGTIRFRLHPQTLGHLRVELSQGDHGTSIRVTADTEQARAIIADAQPRLAAEARAQGVRIAETHVDLSGSDRHASGDPRRQDDARQTPFVRTARATAEDAPASERQAAGRSDRFA